MALAFIFHRRPWLEHLFAESEAELVALDPEHASELRRPAVEHRHLALLLRHQLLKHFVPVGTARVGARLQPRDEVPLLLRAERETVWTRFQTDAVSLALMTCEQRARARQRQRQPSDTLTCARTKPYSKLPTEKYFVPKMSISAPLLRLFRQNCGAEIDIVATFFRHLIYKLSFLMSLADILRVRARPLIT